MKKKSLKEPGEGLLHPVLSTKKNAVCAVVGVLLIVAAGAGLLFGKIENYKYKEQSIDLSKEIERAKKQPNQYGSGITETTMNILQKAIEDTKQKSTTQPLQILSKYQELYEQNQDLVGWLTIDDTEINYPVMQKMDDEDYYLSYDFYHNKDKNGCLILDTDSKVGIGTKINTYENGNKPSTNLIIHGHTMKSGLMFGNLKLYKDKTYGENHSIIKFDSLYEQREYQLIAVFYSQVYYQSDDVFKYYKFFQADTKEEFDEWYENIKKMSLYDTGEKAQFGDEFITLSCCSYHVEDGRFVVVGKRVK